MNEQHKETSEEKFNDKKDAPRDPTAMTNFIKGDRPKDRRSGDPTAMSNYL